MTIVKEQFKAAGLMFEKYNPKDKNNWYGTAAPYASLFTAFTLRLKEVRIGNKKMLLTKKDGKT